MTPPTQTRVSVNSQVLYPKSCISPQQIGIGATSINNKSGLRSRWQTKEAQLIVNEVMFQCLKVKIMTSGLWRWRQYSEQKDCGRLLKRDIPNLPWQTICQRIKERIWRRNNKGMQMLFQIFKEEFQIQFPKNNGSNKSKEGLGNSSTRISRKFQGKSCQTSIS